MKASNNPARHRIHSRRERTVMVLCICRTQTPHLQPQGADNLITLCLRTTITTPTAAGSGPVLSRLLTTCEHHTYSRRERTLKNGQTSSRGIDVGNEFSTNGSFAAAIASFCRCWESLAISPSLPLIALGLSRLDCSIWTIYNRTRCSRFVFNDTMKLAPF